MRDRGDASAGEAVDAGSVKDTSPQTEESVGEGDGAVSGGGEDLASKEASNGGGEPHLEEESLPESEKARELGDGKGGSLSEEKAISGAAEKKAGLCREALKEETGPPAVRHGPPRGCSAPERLVAEDDLGVGGGEGGSA